MLTFGRRSTFNGPAFRNTSNLPPDTYHGDGGSAVAPPMIPMGAGGGGSRFQQSLDNERATNAQSNATFAAGAPLPMTDGASAYGSVAASRAARNAYVGRQQNVSNAQDFAGLGPNYFRNQMVEDQGIDRANAESGAKVGLMGARGGLLKAQGEDLAAKGRIMYPAQAGLLGAQAGGLNAQAQHTTAMIPYDAAASAAGTRAANVATAGTEALIPYIPKHQDQQLQAGQAEIDRARQMTPIIAGQGQAQTAQAQAQTGLLLAQTKQAGAPAPATGADPGEDFKRKQAQYDYYKKIGRDDLATEIFPPPKPQVQVTPENPARLPHTQADLEATARKYGLTIQQVKQRLGIP